MPHTLFSADNHWDPMWMPRNTWQHRLPAKLKEIGPKVVDTDEGSFWEWEGKIRDGAADSRDNEKYRQVLLNRGVDAPEGSLPPTDPKLLIKFMDDNNICTSVFFSSPVKWAIENEYLYREMFRAYSDFVLEQNSVAPDRIIGLPILPARYPHECADEVKRVARAGAKAVELSLTDVGASVSDPVWEPTWQAIEEDGLVLCAHISVPPNVPIPDTARGEAAAFFAANPFVAARPVAQLVMSGVFERHEAMQFCFGETRIGWVPFFIKWLSRQVQVRKLDPTIPLSLTPEEYIKRNVTFTFEEDLIGVQMCAYEWSMLAEVALWGSDYPHTQGLWGEGTANKIDAMFSGIDDQIRQRVTMDHAMRVFGIADAAKA